MRRLAGPLAAAAILHLALILPNHPAAMTWGALRLVPIELPALLLTLLALPARAPLTRAFRLAVAIFLAAMVVLKIADYVSYEALGRRFNPLLDLHLAAAGTRLLWGSIGALPTVAVLAAAAAALGLLGWTLHAATGIWARIDLPRRATLPASLGAIVVAGAGIGEIGHLTGHWRLPANPPGAAFTTRLAYEHARTYAQGRADLARFTALAAATDLPADARLLDRLEGRDILIIFVESYGRASLENPLYAPTHAATLAAAEDELAAAGLAMRSGWLTSPITGGRSWLAHGTLLSGLEIADQLRYGAMIASPRRTLAEIAASAGYHTAAVMPGITMSWPEGPLLGFDAVLDAAGLDYAGPPFNWVTMPDQYTLSAFRERIDTGGRPLFAKVALISSHAPWVPIPSLLPWDEIGDGSAFAPWEGAGDPPAVVWRDRDRVRDQYRKAVDYALSSALSFIARAARQAGDAAPLVVLVGDHQPASFVAQMDSRDVPVHLIAPADLLDAVEAWGWSVGLQPGSDAPVWPMAAFRDRFVSAFSATAPSGLGAAAPDGGPS